MCTITPPEGSSPSQACAWIRSRIDEERAKPEDTLCIDGKTAKECIEILIDVLRHAKAKEAITAQAKNRYDI